MTERIDAHQHFWDIDSGRYDWPTPAEGPIYRTFAPADLESELSPSDIAGTVLVQTTDSLGDTDAMLDVADHNTFVRAVVGWIPLTDVTAAETALDARPHPALRGIRHLIHQEADHDWLLRKDVGTGLAFLAERGLAFDVVAVFPRHLGLVPVIADRHPDLTLVIDHLAKPPYRAAGWDIWSERLSAAADRPNVFAKISGLDTAAGVGWTADELRPAVEVAIEAFTPSRLLFGSDWPVCRLVSDYSDIVVATERMVAALSDDERRDIFGGTARRVYGFGDPDVPGAGSTRESPRKWP